MEELGGSTRPSPSALVAELDAGHVDGLGGHGVPEQVAVSKAFPPSNPTFTLVSVGSGVAMIGIAGGSYASGAQTVTLQAGRPLTLVNTADGVRYELRLESTT